jgi:hypothetical protein
MGAAFDLVSPSNVRISEDPETKETVDSIEFSSLIAVEHGKTRS